VHVCAAVPVGNAVIVTVTVAVDPVATDGGETLPAAPAAQAIESPMLPLAAPG
jgi:hypothetical protein